MSLRNHVDSYSMMITSKYFETPQDYINIVCVCQKYKETLEKFRFNPISDPNKRLFPRIQTQHLYTKEDKKISGIDHYIIHYEVSCSEYIKQDDTEYKNVKAYSDEESLPNFATQLSDRIFFRSNKTKIEIPTNITKVGNNGFSGSEILSFVFGNELTKLHALKFGSECFTSCRFLNYVNILNTIGSFEKRCFSSCYRLETFRCNYSHHLGESLFESSKSLREVYIGDGAEELPKRCFWLCINLQTVKLPTTLTTMDTECFYKCESLTSIHIPKHVTCIPTSCFLLCESCTSITLPTGITSFGPKVFMDVFL